MNLLRVITREESIAGLEISDDYLRLALLELKGKDKTKLEIRALVEIPLTTGTVINGYIKNQDDFIALLKKLIKKSTIKIRYIIVSLPASAVYSRVFTFPKTIQDAKIEETMKLIINFQLPIKPDEVYLDWEKISDNEHNEVFFASAPRPLIDEYLKIFKVVGLKTVAIEFHPMSFSRVVELPVNNAAMIVASDKTNGSFFVIKNKTLYFSRVAPFSLLTKKSLKEETRKIIDFYESDGGKISQLINLNASKAGTIFRVGALTEKDGWKWFTSVGAGWRGLLARSQDTIVSLMPVGTEDAYEYQKATTFAGFLSAIAITLAIFFSIAFIAGWTLMATMQHNTLNRIDSLTTVNTQGDFTALENKATQFNELVGAASDLVKTIPNWSVLIEDLKGRVTEGIIITELSLPSPEQILTVKGTAQSRKQLNSFKKSLDESRFLSEVKLPLTNLEQKENIPFSVSFKLKDQSTLYSF